jgi:predicted peptidase
MPFSFYMATPTKEWVLPYVVYYPDDLADTGDYKYPVIIVLHGRGERNGNINTIRDEYCVKLIIEHTTEKNVIIAAPLIPDDKFWDEYTEGFTAFLAQIMNMPNVDRERIYLTGWSRGGWGAWHFAVRFVDIFAAVVPICGGSEDNNETLAVLVNTPMWVFHGARDKDVALYCSAEPVYQLKKLGSDVKFTISPDRSHDMWTPTYTNQEMYKWMFAQRKTQEPKDS